MTTKLAGIGSAWGTGPAALNSVGVLEYRFVVSLVFNFLSPKWTRNKIIFSVFALPMAFLCLHLVNDLYGHQRIDHAILIANGLVHIALCNEKHDGHVLICILIIIT